ncbi:MAG: hypothetical protein FWF55_03865 [Treponema sp.]|nr:hypothetical protein [Treponema sp.]
MKNVKIMGFIALAAVMGLVLGCEQEPEKKEPSLLSAPSISDAPWSADLKEATYTEALELFNNTQWSFAGAFTDATRPLLIAAATEKYGDPETKWLPENKDQSSSKLEVTIKDGKGKAKDKDGKDAVITVVNGKVSHELKLKGKKLRHYFSITEEDYNESKELEVNGYGESWKESTSMTYNFPLVRFADDYDWENQTHSPSKYLMGGTLKIEKKNNGSKTLKDKDYLEIKDKDIWTNKGSGETKYAFAITIVNTETGKAARFRLSYASKNSNNERKVSKNSYEESADLEIYGAGDNLIGKGINQQVGSLNNISFNLLNGYYRGWW